MIDLRNTRTTILNAGSPEKKREEIRDYFHKTFTIDEKLYDCLADDDAFYLRAEPLRHPLIFYLGHTGVFYINKLIIAKIIDRRINPKFESMFAVGVDEMSWDDLDDAHYDWPTVSEVRAYRQQVREDRTPLDRQPYRLLSARVVLRGGPKAAPELTTKGPRTTPVPRER